MLMRHIYIETYGCSANQSHSEVMMGLLKDSGYKIAKNPKDSDVIILNTCIVKEPTEKRMVYRIKYIREKYPEKKLVVAGCMPAGEYDILRKIEPYASIIGPKSSLKVVECVKKTLSGHRAVYLDENKDLLCQPKLRFNSFINIVEISHGCLGNCAYCIVKKAKGHLKSYPIGDIVKDIKLSLKNGCKEIWLTSQDCGCYGLDIGVTLIDLLKEIEKIPEFFKVRIGMSNPNYILPVLDDLLECYKSDKIYKFLHIPVQSGSDNVLKAMNRHYFSEDFKQIVIKFRKNIPNVTIWTDIIVGFPGETDRDFKETIKLIKETKPDFVNVSKFGVRPGTEAEKMEKVDSETIKKRSRKLSDLVDKISLEKNKEWIGKKCKILVTVRGKKKNQYIGRNESYKSVLIETEKNILGKIVTVKVTGARKSYLIGEII